MNAELQDVRAALGELGRFRFGEMQVEDALHEIVRTTHAVFNVDGAGLMLTDSEQQLRSVAASDDRLAHLEELQIEHSEGPCIAAYEDKQLVGVDDLTADTRWPKFSDAAVSRRVRAVLASPLPYNQDAVGVVAVVSEQSRPWTPEGELALLAFTDLAALLVASTMQGQQHSELAGQLQGATGLAADHRAGQGGAGGTARHHPAGCVRAAAGPGPGRAAQGLGPVRRSGAERHPPGLTQPPQQTRFTPAYGFLRAGGPDLHACWLSAY